MTDARASSLVAVLDKMADHVLEHGLTQATLRPLARAAGTSDRMLIYHFGSKEGVIAALLDHLALRLTTLLDSIALPPARSMADLIEMLVAVMQDPAARPYASIWFEVIAGASRDTPAHREAAARIVTHFQGWITARLPQTGSAPDDASATAALALCLIEGTLLLGSAGAPGAMLATAGLAGFRRATTPKDRADS